MFVRFSCHKHRLMKMLRHNERLILKLQVSFNNFWIDWFLKGQISWPKGAAMTLFAINLLQISTWVAKTCKFSLSSEAQLSSAVQSSAVQSSAVASTRRHFIEARQNSAIP